MSKVRPFLMLGVVVALGAVTVVLAGGRLPWTSTPHRCDIPASVAGGAVSSSAAPGGGGVRVIEQGFTGAEDHSVSLGAIVENSSTSVAYRTRVTFRTFDAEHNLLPPTEGSVDRRLVEIPVILPGQRTGVGLSTLMTRSTEIASFEVEMGTTTWVSRPALGQDYEPTTGAYLRVLRFNPKTPFNVDIHYKETSPSCRSLGSRRTATVFRDAGGKIVGGSLDSPGGLIIFRDEQGRDLGGEWTLPAGQSCDQGERETWLTPSVPVPAVAADARTEVYPYCDLASPPYSSKPGTPGN
ncbi:hypothetical protein [Amycolatopsis sp. H20-H5]|uniref:hypothetical protein n=1 Tax=Amycolatopsis sp. H20-H5 TaxID=3046309 RepID=UPI002DBEB987|nr:hypothetical protein [Amycolatopsis sp. H20-H5]MEC3982450.1 hypothetical protein [Amycolatopsis sp. H20-H5]